MPAYFVEGLHDWKSVRPAPAQGSEPLCHREKTARRRPFRSKSSYTATVRRASKVAYCPISPSYCG